MADDPRKAAGLQLRQARESRGLSIRAAARLAELWLQESNPSAKFSEGLWRNMEKGERSVSGGVTLPVNPYRRNVYAAAAAVGLDGDKLLDLYDQTADEPEDEHGPDGEPSPGEPAGEHPAVRSLRALMDWVGTLPPGEQERIRAEALKIFGGGPGVRRPATGTNGQGDRAAS